VALFWVALGGACGASLRYLLVKFLSGGMLNFPLGTLVANVSGSFLIGFLAGSFFLGEKINTDAKLFFQTGVLGAFTTFSAFSLETLQLWQSGNAKTAAINIVLNVGLCLLAVVLGMALGSALIGRAR